MARIPFGISRFDELIDGGAPSGSSVLLSGQLGAGAREFCYTSATMSALALADRELFELYYGTLDEEVGMLPDEVHYVSCCMPPRAVETELGYVLEDDIIETAIDSINFLDLSDQYFKRSRVPMEWYSEATPDIDSLGEIRGSRGVLGLLGDYLSEHARDNLIVIDSLTDMVISADETMSWTDIIVLMKGLSAAAHRWDGLILMLVNNEVLSETEVAGLMNAAHGNIVFEWETGGNERTRTMYVKQFRGVLSRLEDEDIIRFETDIYDHGFDITGVRRIR